MDEEGETGVEASLRLKLRGNMRNVGRMMASEKADKVRRLDVETEIINFWNEMLESVTFFSSQRHKLI